MVASSVLFLLLSLTINAITVIGQFDTSKDCFFDRQRSDGSDLGVYSAEGPIAAPFLVFNMLECIELCQKIENCCRARYLYGNCMGRRCELYGVDSDRTGDQARGYQAIECSYLENRNCDVVIEPQERSCFEIRRGDDAGTLSCHGS
uniref:Apple domain-containing protein n=1 Tax=Ditylum brightwellii TaxID=49249 RepID=A0A7S1YT44_9STRA